MQPNGNQAPYGGSPHQFTPNPYAQATQQMVPVEMPKEPKPMALIVSFIATLVILLGAIGFGAWAFSSRQDYKNNFDQKLKVESAKIRDEESKAKAAEYAEREKYPYKQYKGPATLGTLNILYPKTWSAFVTEKTDGTIPLEGYFHPNYIPGLESGTAFALYIRVVEKSYNSELGSFNNAAKKGAVKVTPYSAPKVAKVVGSRVTGQLDSKIKNGVIILLPLRDKTIEISAQSRDFEKDLDNIVLANLTFEP